MKNTAMGPSTRLRLARELAGKSLSDAAKLVGRSRQAVHKWEHDPAQVKAGHLNELCRFYGVSMDSVFSELSAPLSDEAIHMAAQYDALPRDLKRQWNLLWGVFGRRGAKDPVGRVS